ncbi:MAG TPA: N-acetylmuramoyl-L-alanine amidase [Dehalococcoidia bacterium]|nr:N-acetylmuramoyl-L-alanine amidase [Dehalococcoidia bacterium]
MAGYGTPGKAHEVATYLDRILGPAPDRPEDNKMVKPPDGIKWIGTSNFSRGRDGHRPVAIVNHIMEGTLAACDSWFNNRESQVSAHFGIGQNGEIHQYVRTVDTAWANGRCNQPDLSVEWLADCVRRQVNANSLTISIEHEGKTGDRMSEAQYQATLALHRYLIAEYGIPVDRMHIIGHNRIDSINRSRCPGAGFPWDRLLADLGGGTVQPQPGSRDHLPKEVVKPPEGIRWVGSPNFAADRAGHRPVAIVCHTLESTLAAADASFADPAAQVSTHFAIGRHGEKHQYVRTVDTAWGNGATNQPDLTIAWLAEAVQGGVNPNLLTVSLGFEGKSGEPLTEPQYQAGLELVRYLIDLWDVPVDKDHVIGHSRIDSVGQATCPGQAFPWDRLFGDLLSGPAEPQALTAVQALDEIWRIAGLIEADRPAEADTLRRMVAVMKG